VTDDELDAVSNELVGDRDALLRVGNVVAEFDDDLLAVDAAGSVDVCDSLFGTLLQLRAECGVRASQGASNADEQVSPCSAAVGNHCD
jgi:hypothetical protein